MSFVIFYQLNTLILNNGDNGDLTCAIEHCVCSYGSSYPAATPMNNYLSTSVSSFSQMHSLFTIQLQNVLRMLNQTGDCKLIQPWDATILSQTWNANLASITVGTFIKDTFLPRLFWFWH